MRKPMPHVVDSYYAAALLIDKAYIELEKQAVAYDTNPTSVRMYQRPGQAICNAFDIPDGLDAQIYFLTECKDVCMALWGFYAQDC